MAFTPWHLDAVSGSHPPHLLSGVKQTSQSLAAWSASDPFRTFNDAAPEVFGAPFLDCLSRLGAS